MGNPNRRGASQRPPVRFERDSDDPAVRTTFYVTNITDRVTGLQLREAFKEFVSVTDAWVPRKRSFKGRVFGFVRCEKLSDPYVVLDALNGIVIKDSRISVSLAMFDRSRNRISYGETDPPKKNWVPKDKNVMVDEFPGLSKVYGTTSGTRKTIQIDDDAAYPRHCMGRAIIGTADNIACMHKVKTMLVTAGFSEAAVSYIGGLSVLITFRDADEMNDFLIAKEINWREVFLSASPWNGQYTPMDRIVVLKVVGLPVLIRDSSVIDRIGGLFGKVVWPSDFSWISVDNAVGYTHVLTSLASRIDEEVALLWKGRNYPVWVVEDQVTWVPEFETVRSGDHIDDMEEGEFRPASAAASDGVQGTEEPVTIEPDFQPKSPETVNVDNDLPSFAALGNAASFQTFVGQSDTSQLHKTPVGQMSEDVFNGPPSESGFDFRLGHFEAFKSRKRTRIQFHNSPEDHVINRSNYQEASQQEGNLSCPDLNIGVSEVAVDENLGMPETRTEVIHSAELPVVDGAVTGGITEEVSDVVFSEAEQINKEVDATIQVVGLVGIGLNEFAGQVADEIVSEYGNTVCP